MEKRGHTRSAEDLRDVGINGDLLARGIRPEKILCWYGHVCEGFNGFYYNLAEIA